MNTTLTNNTHIVYTSSRAMNVEGDGTSNKVEKTPELKAREAAEFLDEDQWWKRHGLR